jgi:hypothetical protein
MKMNDDCGVTFVVVVVVDDDDEADVVVVVVVNSTSTDSLPRIGFWLDMVIMKKKMLTAPDGRPRDAS